MKPFNEKITYLGTLCNHNHEYGSTGMSLRRFKGKQCVVCQNAHSKKFSDNNPEYYKNHNITYYQENKEKRNKQSAVYREKHRKGVNSRQKRRDRLSCANLGDTYLSRMLYRSFNIKRSIITPEIMQMKRDQLLFARAIRSIEYAYNN